MAAVWLILEEETVDMTGGVMSGPAGGGVGGGVGGVGGGVGGVGGGVTCPLLYSKAPMSGAPP